MEDIELKNVEIIEGYSKFIKRKYDKFLGYLKDGTLPIFLKGDKVYLFSDFSIDEYRLGELGLKVESYYKNMEKRYRLFLHSVFFGATNVKELHTMGLVTDEVYQEAMKDEKGRIAAYSKERIEKLKKEIEYQEKVIKEYESNS